jgi:hypothetical protein
MKQRNNKTINRKETMKKLHILIIILSLFLTTLVHATTATFTWDANKEPNLKGYRLHHGTKSGEYTTALAVGNVTKITQEIPEGYNFYALTAYAEDQNIESGFSTEIVFPVITPQGDTFVDNFDTNTIEDYYVEYSTPQKWGKVLYNSVAKDMEIQLADNINLAIAHKVPEFENFKFSMVFKPTKKFPAGGRFELKLSESNAKYIFISNTDGYDPGNVNGVPFTSNYIQKETYIIDVTLVNKILTVEAFGEVVSITLDEAVKVGSFSIRLRQQNAHIDDISFVGLVPIKKLEIPVNFKGVLP